ncbi:MAG: anhydro-N-acetylmuramic acid kinase [Ekhidna sp.]
MVSQRKDKTSYSVIGAMAGSSMDGLDLAHAVFEKKDEGWTYQLLKCETVEYSNKFYDLLKQSPTQNIDAQSRLDIAFGEWIAQSINDFKHDILSIDLLGVHGHTVVHDPQKKVSWQLGNGGSIAKATGIPTVTDFRSEDVKNGGQGAPLVPIGDFLLFKGYDACLNLGGIANISLKQKKTAWDICPCNQVLNFFAEKIGQPYDRDGLGARAGSFDENFYDKIVSLDYFSQMAPKSLANNFIDETILKGVDPLDGLHTYSKIISEQIQKELPDSINSQLLITGGGAFNVYLIDLIKDKLKGWTVSVPDEKMVSFKEALVFAFLALKRLKNEINTHSSVTGSSKDISSGVIHLP